MRHARVPRGVNQRLAAILQYGANRWATRAATGHVTLGRRVRIDPTARVFCNGGSIALADGVAVGRNALLQTWGGWIEIGEQVGIGPNCLIYGHGGLVIGPHTLIAGNVVVIPADHVFSDPDVPIRQQPETKEGVRIGHDVWIAASVTILDGVSIGDGAVIAAGAVVTEDVPPLAVMAGVPARVLRFRGDGDPSGSR